MLSRILSFSCAMLAVMVIASGCSKDMSPLAPSSTVSSHAQMDTIEVLGSSASATKPVAGAANARLVAVVVLQLHNMAIPGAKVQMTRTVSGQNRVYRWSTTASQGGLAIIQIEETATRQFPTVSGYYQIDITNKGKVIANIPLPINPEDLVTIYFSPTSELSITKSELALKTYSLFWVTSESVMRGYIGSAGPGVGSEGINFMVLMTYGTGNGNGGFSCTSFIERGDAEDVYDVFAAQSNVALDVQGAGVSSVLAPSGHQVNFTKWAGTVRITSRLWNRSVTIRLNPDGSASVVDDGLPSVKE